MNLNNIVKMEGISKKFGNFYALKNVSFHLSEGKTVALLGPNGAGKSTLIRILLGFIPPTTGTVTVFQKPIHELTALDRRRIAYIPDVTQLWSELNALHHLDLFSSLNDPSENPKRDDNHLRILELVRLPREAWKRRVGTYSHGMRRKLTIACALVHHPDLILMDEPTLGLDPSSLHDFIDIMTTLKDEKVTIFLATHDLMIVEYLADQAIFINNGEIIRVFTKEELAKTNLRQLYLEFLAFPHD